jgi:hypothetical protein
LASLAVCADFWLGICLQFAGYIKHKTSKFTPIFCSKVPEEVSKQKVVGNYYFTILNASRIFGKL